MTDALTDALRPIVAALVAEELAKRADGPRPLLDIPSAQAAMGGISRPALYSLLNRGELRSVKVGRRRFIPATAVADYIEAQTPATTT